MSEGSVVYADVKFNNNKRTKKRDDATASNEVTYSEVKIPEPQRNQPSKDHHKPNRGSKVKTGGFDPVRVVLAVLCVLLAAAVLVLIVALTVLRSHLPGKGEHHENEKKNLTKLCKDWKANHSPPSCTPCVARSSPRGKGCQQCPRDWEHHGGKCYYFSNANNKLNWSQSHDDCITRGGHLAIIESEDEQVFLNRKGSTMLNEGDEKFWIGLTDQREEDTWLWVDNTPLTKSYWFHTKDKTEPDNWQGANGRRSEGEDCVRLAEKDTDYDLKCWFDYFCGSKQRRICETKAIEP